MSVHFSSKTAEWETPQAFFDKVNAVHGPLVLDVCANVGNAKCPRFYTRAEDGLVQPWNGVCWMNPPYGREIGKWVRKAAESAGGGTKVVCLLPARTDTKWFHDYVLPYGKVEFIRGRLKFGGGANSAPFPSMLVVFDGENPCTVPV
jgi:phage N-6-adenine-methyltransferase